MPEMIFPCTLVGVAVLTFARSNPRNSFVEPLIVVVSVSLAAPKPITLPVTVNAPASPKFRPAFMVIPAYRRAAPENVRGAVWKIRLWEIVQLSLLAWMLIPETDVVALKKSKMLLLSIRLLVLSFGLGDPNPMTHFVGKFAFAGPMLLPEMVLLLFPPATVLVLKSTLPPAVLMAEIEDPRTVQRVTVSLEAPLMNRMVLLPAVLEAVVLEMVSALPPVPSPSMVTSVAPLKSISGLPVAIAPEIVRATPPEGWTEIEV